MLSAVASSWASLSAAPSRRNTARLRSFCASQLGRGKLPMVVAAMGGSCIDSPQVEICSWLYTRERRNTSLKAHSWSVGVMERWSTGVVRKNRGNRVDDGG